MLFKVFGYKICFNPEPNYLDIAMVHLIEVFKKIDPIMYT